MHSLSEPEGDCSDCSSYDELSSVSDNEINEEEELILFNQQTYDNDYSDNRRGSTASNYRSWYLKRRGSKTISEAETTTESTSSKNSLTVINESQKNWLYWTKLAIFVASPFIAKQLGIIVGKRILGRIFKSSTTKF